jgi:hypothetical protein
MTRRHAPNAIDVVAPLGVPANVLDAEMVADLRRNSGQFVREHLVKTVERALAVVAADRDDRVRAVLAVAAAQVRDDADDAVAGRWGPSWCEPLVQLVLYG